MTRFGFKSSDLPKDLSLALGTLTVSPMELVRAYAVLANGGYLVKPYVVAEIQDIDGNTLVTARPAVACNDCAQPRDPGDGEIVPAKRVMEPRTHYLMNSMLGDVIKRGTATKARALGRGDLAGKTGTTNGPTDAWFSGYNRDIVTTVWLGFDQNEHLGRREYGGTAALPIWMDFMGSALEGKPESSWEQPNGMTMVRIDPVSGLLARPGQQDAIFEIFRTELAPTEYAETGYGGTGASGGEELLEEDLF